MASISSKVSLAKLYSRRLGLIHSQRKRRYGHNHTRWLRAQAQEAQDAP